MKMRGGLRWLHTSFAALSCQQVYGEIIQYAENEYNLCEMSSGYIQLYESYLRKRNKYLWYIYLKLKNH